MEQISIIPDTHVMQASAYLGITPASATPQQVEDAWHELLQGSGIVPVQLHPILWHWSRNNYQPALAPEGNLYNVARTDVAVAKNATS